MNIINEKDVEQVVGGAKAPVTFPCMKKFHCGKCGNTGMQKFVELGEMVDFLERGCPKCHEKIAFKFVEA